MRRLILFRHSKTEAATPGQSDQQRPLAPGGRADAALMGTYLAHHKVAPDRALVSPARRALETWTLASAALHPVPEAITDGRIYGASPEQLFRIVETAANDAGSLMIVGHNPGLHELAVKLVATGDLDARESLHEKFPTSGLAVIDFAFDRWDRLHPQSGRLERFTAPRLLTGEAR